MQTLSVSLVLPPFPLVLDHLLLIMYYLLHAFFSVSSLTKSCLLHL